MEKVLKSKNTESVASDNDTVEVIPQTTSSGKEEISPVGNFLLPNNKFYVVLWKHSNCSYTCKLLNDTEIELTMVAYPNKEDLKELATYLGVDTEMIDSFYSESIFTRIIKSPKPLLQHKVVYTNDCGSLAAFSFSP